MNLLSVQGLGFLFLILLLLICIILVHCIKLIVLGYRTLGKKLPAKKPKQEPEKKPETVYYLVERKKKRVKTEYTEPQRIQFK